LITQKTNSFERFWQELKRRKVFSVVTTYAATAYIIIEVVNNLIGPLHLPDWLATLVVILLIIGLPIVIILSWIFDFTPQGIKKTESLEELESKEIAAKPVKRKLRASYVLNAILIIAVIVLAYPKIIKKEKLANLRSSDGKISVVVMPFKNLTADTLFNIWQLGLQNLLITSLSNSEELSVRQYETMDKILEGIEQTNYASITPSFAADVALKLEANTVITGNIFKTINRIRVTANLMDSRNEEIYKSYDVYGNTEDDFFTITDSLSRLIKNYLEMKKLKQKYPIYDLKNVYTSSAEAFKLFIQGRTYHARTDYITAIEIYLKAVDYDSSFVSPMLMLSYACGDIGKTRESKMWAYKAYDRISKMPYDIQMEIREVKAAVDKEPNEHIKSLKEYLEFNPYSPVKTYTLGWVYYITEQWQDAINEFEKANDLIKLFSGRKLWIWHYLCLGDAYHKIGEHGKESKIYKDGLDSWPDEKHRIISYQAVCTFSQGDTAKAHELLTEFRTTCKKVKFSNSRVESDIGLIYQKSYLLGKAQHHYQLAIKSEPSDIYNTWAMYYLAWLLIDNDIAVGEGIKLADSALKKNPADEELLANIYDTRGWGFYKLGNYDQALEYLKKGWDLRPFYGHQHFLHLEAAKKAVAGQKNN
jgi:tetratricopeptide (TPR) repeat protein